MDKFGYDWYAFFYKHFVIVIADNKYTIFELGKSLQLI